MEEVGHVVTYRRRFRSRNGVDLSASDMDVASSYEEEVRDYYRQEALHMGDSTLEKMVSLYKDYKASLRGVDHSEAAYLKKKYAKELMRLYPERAHSFAELLREDRARIERKMNKRRGRR